MFLYRTCLLAAILSTPVFGQGDQLKQFLAGKRLANAAPDNSKAPARKDILLTRADASIPQVASAGSFDLGGFLTFFDFVNIAGVTAEFTVLFLDDQGNLIEMPIIARNPDGSACIECPPEFVAGIADTLEPGQSLQQALVPAGPPRIGWAGILTTPDVSVGVTATFMQIVPGRPLFMAGIPPSTVLQKRAWLSAADVAGFTTSVALVNTDPNEVQNFTLIYRENFGQELCRTSFPIVPFGHSAFLLRTVLPCAAGQEGSVEIIGSSFFSGVGFWAHDTGGFVTQPLLERD